MRGVNCFSLPSPDRAESVPTTDTDANARVTGKQLAAPLEKSLGGCLTRWNIITGILFCAWNYFTAPQRCSLWCEGQNGNIGMLKHVWLIAIRRSQSLVFAKFAQDVGCYVHTSSLYLWIVTKTLSFTNGLDLLCDTSLGFLAWIHTHVYCHIPLPPASLDSWQPFHFKRQGMSSSMCFCSEAFEH